MRLHAHNLTAEIALLSTVSLDLGQCLVEDFHRDVRLLARQNERWRKADRVDARAEKEQASGESRGYERVSLPAGALFGLPIADELDADHQSAATDVPDQ